MKKTKQGTMLIYVLFLVTLSSIFAVIVLNNAVILFGINNYFDNELKLVSNINSDSSIVVDISRELNKNGSGFTDNISCPSGTSLTLSGNLDKIETGSLLKYEDKRFFCLSKYKGNDVKIFFNTGITDFEEASYSGYIVSLTNQKGDTKFGDDDETYMDFSSYDKTIKDDLDDNLNSDNYTVTSTGNINYNYDYQDDDSDGRKMLFGYVPPNIGFKKIFWNNSNILKVINENTNNNDDFNYKATYVNTGVLYIDIDKKANLKLFKLDRLKYDSVKELNILNEYTGSIDTGVKGFLQYKDNKLGFSGSVTGNEYIFNFAEDDYALFLESTSTGTLLYKVYGKANESNNGSIYNGPNTYSTGVYIVPLDDSKEDLIKYWGNEIIIMNNGNLMAKEMELIYKK